MKNMVVIFCVFFSIVRLLLKYGLGGGARKVQLAAARYRGLSSDSTARFCRESEHIVLGYAGIRSRIETLGPRVDAAKARGDQLELRRLWAEYEQIERDRQSLLMSRQDTSFLNTLRNDVTELSRAFDV